MQKSKQYSQQCTSFVHALSYREIPEETLLKMKGFFLDYLGCAVGGYSQTQAMPAKSYLQKLGGSHQCSAIGQSQLTSISSAAFFHGYLGHILEMDDVDRESITHPGTVVIPAALAVGEWRNSNGKALLTSLIAGYETMLAIGAAITPAHYKIWHTTGTAGAFGAAMAAGKLLELTPQGLSWALGNAGTMAAGLWQFLQDGAMSKFLHAGRAAENGVVAAYLATENFSGAKQILEGDKGFFIAFARQEIDDAIFEQLGRRYRTATVSIKPYPCCRHTHSSIDAADRLRSQLNLADIDAIRVETYGNAVQVANNQDPQTPQEAKFSLTFCIARTLIEGTPTEKSFSPSTLNDPLTRALMDKISIVATPEQDNKLPRYWPSRITAVCDNRQIIAEADSPTGDPDSPLSWQKLVDKFTMLTEGRLTPEGQKTLAAACLHLEETDNVGSIIATINKYLYNDKN
jgi:2-methylcitrate dehydratase PrpD